ncbi:ABC-type transport system, involved in lipoprotein release, permease component [Ruminiclostridium cellobioparum subsp. termitidis CT1112]|uniref:ABC-type transport system, involved in lipoprotein release, permease component n=2 Tax=Ruminiclostridium cellobioparum TaxID=29355 RepID=S0FQD0_RUMCE|nr:ABC-type transport system, involved in lipoprotein release, permease component [Ruminiclostridium cellobioparum subsp. termitidis CT1112]
MVMSKLFLKLLRDIKDYKGQFIAITIVIIVGAFFFVGFSTFAKNLNVYANNYFTNTNLADLWANYSKISPENADKLKQIIGVQNVEGRLVMNFNQKFDDLKTTLKFHSIAANNIINKITIIEGNKPSEFQSIVLDTDYAKEHSYKVGDTIKISTPFKEDVSLKISGLCESSEYTIKSRDTSDFPPNHKEYGIAYVSEDTMAGITGEKYYNEVLIDAAPGADLKAITRSIAEVSKDLSYLYTLNRDATLSYKQFTSEIAQQDQFSKVLPLIFFGVAAVIIFLTLSRLIDSQRTQIGIMKALGTRESIILSHYLGYAIFVGLAGGIIGSILGCVFFTQLFMAQVKAIISLPGFTIHIYYYHVLLALLLSVVFGILASYMSCRTILREKAAEAMRIKPPKKVKKTLIERNTFLWSRLSYGSKLILRNVFINKKRAIYSSLGVICCIAFLILSFGYKGSRALLIEKQFTEVYKYDLRVVYKDPIADDESLEIPRDQIDYNTLAQTSVVITNLADEKDFNLLITNKENNFISNYDNKGKLLPLDDDGVIIAERFAEKYKLSIGDILDMKLIDPAYNGKSFKTKISNISVQYLNQEIYCTPAFLSKAEVTCPPSTLLIKEKDPSKAEDVYSFFSGRNDVKEVKSKNDVKKLTESGLQNLYNMIIVLIVCAIVLSSAAIYNISAINITERVRELATLKVLGYHISKINNLIFAENFFITIFSLIIGTPLGIYLYKTILKAFTLDNMVFPIYVSLDSILFPIIITILVTTVCNLFLRRAVKKIDMIESLKSVE